MIQREPPGHKFDDLEALCLFVGHPRSGSTLVASIIDAHPDAVIAHERSIQHLVLGRLKREDVFAQLLESEKAFTNEGRICSGYDYNLNKSWHGQFRKLKIIGDKKAGASSDFFGQNPNMLLSFSERLQLPVKLIHVIRNPMDNIVSLRSMYISNGENMTLTQASDLYFSLLAGAGICCETVGRKNFLRVYLEELIANPAGQINQIYKFLNLELEPTAIDLCVKRIFKEPHLARNESDWTKDRLVDLQMRAKQFPELAFYF